MVVDDAKKIRLQVLSNTVFAVKKNEVIYNEYGGLQNAFLVQRIHVSFQECQ